MLLLSIKLKNLLPASYACKLRNVAINGDKRGCTGFIQHNGATVYVNTEVLGGGYLARTAASDKDYGGGRNRYAKTPESLVLLVTELLRTPHSSF